jgi:hypothetical protein
LLEECPQDEAEWVAMELARDKGTYAVMLALVLGIDDRSSRCAVVRWSAYTSRLAVRPGFADRFFDLLKHARWIQEVQVEQTWRRK